MAIVDTSNGFNVEKRDMKAEGILMHRERNVIAVRAPQGDAQTIVQVSSWLNLKLKIEYSKAN